MPDLLDRIREEISTRLAALRPLMEEHSRLDAAMQALGQAPPQRLTVVAPPASSSPRPTARAQTTPAVKPRKRAPKGANREAVLRAARERPGATATELAAVSKVDRNTLNTLLARLVEAGELHKRALPSGRAGYALDDAAPVESTVADEQVAGVAPPASSPSQPKARAPKTSAGKARKRAPKGANREAVLRVARERPGATAAELAAVSNVDRNTLNVLLSRLVKAGELQKRALPTGRTGYALSDTTPADPIAADEQVAASTPT